MDWTITEYVNRKGATTLSGLVVSVARIQVEQLPSPIKNVCSTVLIPNANTIPAQRTLYVQLSVACFFFFILLSHLPELSQSAVNKYEK